MHGTPLITCRGLFDFTSEPPKSYCSPLSVASSTTSPGCASVSFNVPPPFVAGTFPSFDARTFAVAESVTVISVSGWTAVNVSVAPWIGPPPPNKPPCSVQPCCATTRYVPVIAEVGRRSDASFEYEKQPVPKAPLPGHFDQSFVPPFGP